VLGGGSPGNVDDRCGSGSGCTGALDSICLSPGSKRASHRETSTTVGRLAVSSAGTVASTAISSPALLRTRAAMTEMGVVSGGTSRGEGGSAIHGRTNRRGTRTTRRPSAYCRRPAHRARWPSSDDHDHEDALRHSQPVLPKGNAEHIFLSPAYCVGNACVRCTVESR
jgi:hypothetical protein